MILFKERHMRQRNIEIEKKLFGGVFLVTGGTGSFGNAVINRLLGCEPKKIIVFSRDEKKQFDMMNFYHDKRVSYVIGDVRDRDSVAKAMRGVDFVFHAAALKQVPTCEFFPLEAVKTNVIGASNVIDEAILKGVKRLVILSTDKAVYPINAMGMTKALMEKVMIASSKKNGGDRKTILCGTRYGNVMCSRGSVIPYFVNLCKNGQKLPVTEYRMTRFMMSMSQAVDLVLYAFANGSNGDIYVRKAPACTLEVLAKVLCKLFKNKGGYEEVGIRAGEKVYETLVSYEEMFRAVDEGDYFRIFAETQGLDYDKYFNRGEKMEIDRIKPFTSENTRRLNEEETERLLLGLDEVKNELKE